MTILAVISILAALESSPASVSIASDSACPSADAVRVALLGLGGTQPPREAAVMVRNRNDSIVVEFGWPGDTQPESRELAVVPDCEARAQAAAVVIASWLGMLPQASLQTPPLGIPFAETRYTMLSPPAAVEPVTPRPSTAVAARDDRPAMRSWLGAGLGAMVGGGVVPGLRVELAREQTGQRMAWGWLTSAFVGLPRSRIIADGTSHWVRPGLGVAGMASWQHRRIQLGLDLGPLAGLAVAWGSDYPVNQTAQSLTWGWSSGLRLQVVSTSSRAWIEMRAVNWLRRQRLQHVVLPSGRLDAVDLPSWEAQLTLGFGLATVRAAAR
jgi:hypothetical protein